MGWLFCGELFYSLFFGAVADEELAVLLGKDAVVDSLNDYSFGGFHVDNIIGRLDESHIADSGIAVLVFRKFLIERLPVAEV